MSKIEEQAKGTLESLMFSKKITLDRTQIERLAAWFALKAMMFEYAGHPDSLTIPKSDYDYIRSSLLAPKHWRMWMGSQNSAEWVMRCFNLPTTTVFLSDLPNNIGPNRPRKCNVLTTSFGLGQLFAYVSLSNAPRLLDKHDATIDNSSTPGGEPGMLKIWPYCGDVAWPRSFFLSTIDLDEIANSINSISGDVPPQFREAVSIQKEPL